MPDCGYEMDAHTDRERRTLLLVLAINSFMFIFELLIGLIAQSTGLIADSLDMLADASVYLISLYAVRKSLSLKIKAAILSGYAQIFLALMVLFDVLRRFIYGSEPVSILMITIGFIALIANSLCFVLIAGHRKGEVHMRASYIFSKNDVIANLGVILSGFLVFILRSRYPDLAIGTIIAILVLMGGITILKESKEAGVCNRSNLVKGKQ